MRRPVLLACVLAGAWAPAAIGRAAEPAGVLICAPKGGGFDCAQGKCNPSRVTTGGDIRLDFGAKSMCSLRGSECQQPRKLDLAILEEPGNTVVAASSGEGATMLFRIGADMKMAMVFVVGTGRVLTFQGECRKP